MSACGGASSSEGTGTTRADTPEETDEPKMAGGQPEAGGGQATDGSHSDDRDPDQSTMPGDAGTPSQPDDADDQPDDTSTTHDAGPSQADEGTDADDADVDPEQESNDDEGTSTPDDTIDVADEAATDDDSTDSVDPDTGDPPETEDVWESTDVSLQPVPEAGDSWNLPTADSLNATPAALARFEDSIVLAGAAPPDVQEDPDTAEAFVARLDAAGDERWRTVLPDSGFPHDLVVDSDGSILVMTPYSPESTFLNPSGYNEQFMLIRLDADGKVVDEAVRDLGEGGDIIMGMATDADGSIFVTGAAGPSPSTPFLAKYDGEFSEQWITIYDHPGSQAWTPAIATLPNGDVAITGYFDETIDFGGDTLVSQGMSGSFSVPNGFVARFDNDGEHIFSFRFGGNSIDGGTAIAVLDDDLIVTGSLTGVADVGGVTVEASEEGSAVIARIDATGSAKWVEVFDGFGQAVAVHEPSGNIYVAGTFGDSGILLNYDAEGTLLETVGSVDGEVRAYDMALDVGLGVWVTGTYSGSVDFGNENLLTSERPGVFLVRLSQSIEP